MKPLLFISVLTFLCSSISYAGRAKGNPPPPASLSAQEILGNPDYPAISYGGYRHASREQIPAIEQLKEDLRILSALDIKLLRTYNTQQYAHAALLLEAIHQLKSENPNFEMYVLLGPWIECQDAWTETADRHAGNTAKHPRPSVGGRGYSPLRLAPFRPGQRDDFQLPVSLALKPKG